MRGGNGSERKGGRYDAWYREEREEQGGGGGRNKKGGRGGRRERVAPLLSPEGEDDERDDDGQNAELSRRGDVEHVEHLGLERCVRPGNDLLRPLGELLLALSKLLQEKQQQQHGEERGERRRRGPCGGQEGEAKRGLVDTGGGC